MFQMTEDLEKLFSTKAKVLRGELFMKESLAKYTWLKVGGAADILFSPKDETDLSQFLADLPSEIPITILGNASNLIIRDGGVPGIVIRVGSRFSEINIDGSSVKVGAGAACLNIARKAYLAGLGGLEFLSGIPGTAGGALWMNSGAYGDEIKDIFYRARAIDKFGLIHHLDSENIIFDYRFTSIDPDWVILEVEFLGKHAARDKVAERMEEIASRRSKTQPIRTMTGGSTFKNPKGQKAWQLIEAAGCKGLKKGGAVVSELHCNFLVNNGQATARDLEDLGERVRQQVYEKTGFRLDWEIERIGI